MDRQKDIQKDNLWPDYKKMTGTYYSQKNNFVLWKGAMVWYCKISTLLKSRSYTACSKVWYCASFSWLKINFFAAMRLRQYLLYLNRSKVVTHICAFCEKTSTISFQRKTNTSWCASLYFRSIQKEISLSKKNFYIRFPCGKRKALICSSLLLSPLPRGTPDRWGLALGSAGFNSEWERSKYHIPENISFTYFQHKMHNKAGCPANMQTSPAAEPYRRPKCAGKSTGSSIPGAGVREIPLPASVTWIRSPALINAGEGHDYLLLERWTCLPTTGAKLTSPGVRMGDGCGGDDRLPL